MSRYWLRSFINLNFRLSSWINSKLPRALQVDGNKTFLKAFATRAGFQHAVVYDVGGGSQPFHSRISKKDLKLTIVGLDISDDELGKAPEGIYDRKVAANLCEYHGCGDADAIICQATLEHVDDAAGAMRGLASILKDGGLLYLFAPCRNALFARLNLALPQGIKQRVLFYLFPSKATGHDGFEAYYNGCTPSEIERLAIANNLIVKEKRYFWMSSYFFVFAPAYIIWRVYQAFSYLLIREDAAETFIYILEKGTLCGEASDIPDAPSS